MLASRILRSIPRTTSRLAITTAPRTAFKSSLLPSLRPIPSLITFALPRAAFTTSARKLDDISQELSAKLASEIALEEENTESQHDSDAGVEAFLQANDHWALEAPEGQQDVILRRKYDDELITVSFSVVDFNTATAVGMDGEEGDEAFVDEEEELAGKNEGAINQGKGGNANFKVMPEDSIAPADREEEARIDEDDYDAQAAFPANVSVLIQRPGRGALRINLVTDAGRFTIHGLTHLPESSPTASATDLLRHGPDAHYTGPPFQQLDEDVQALLEQYLDVRGINTALAVFIPDYIDVKEQKEYLGWLKRVKDFVEPV